MCRAIYKKVKKTLRALFAIKKEIFFVVRRAINVPQKCIRIRIGVA